MEKHPAERSTIEVLAALKELVELKDMKDSVELNQCDRDKKQEILNEYSSRKKVAWATARRLVKKYEFLGVKA